MIERGAMKGIYIRNGYVGGSGRVRTWNLAKRVGVVKRDLE